MEKLQKFQRSWKLHDPLLDTQLAHAGAVAKVTAVGFYHGGDVLYSLENLPGIWHEVCLEDATG